MMKNCGCNSIVAGRNNCKPFYKNCNNYKGCMGTFTNDIYNPGLSHQHAGTKWHMYPNFETLWIPNKHDFLKDEITKLKAFLVNCYYFLSTIMVRSLIIKYNFGLVLRTVFILFFIFISLYHLHILHYWINPKKWNDTMLIIVIRYINISRF